MSAACPQFAFQVELRLAPGLTPYEREAVLNAFMALVDARGLVLDDAPRRDMLSFLVRSEAAQATDADRDAVQRWADAEPRVERLRIGALVDLREE